MTELSELAKMYGWQVWGDAFILEKANGEFHLNEDCLCFVCACCTRTTVIKSDLKKKEVRNILKILGDCR